MQYDQRTQNPHIAYWRNLVTKCCLLVCSYLLKKANAWIDSVQSMKLNSFVNKSTDVLILWTADTWQWWSLGLIIRDRDQDRDLSIRDRDRNLTIRDRDHPFRDRDLWNPRPKPNIFLVKYFSTRKTSFFHWGYGNLPPTECLFHASCSFFSSFRSCGLDRVVSSKTETFETRGLETGLETRPGLETSITDTW